MNDVTSPARNLSSSGRYDVTVFITRAQPWHLGHQAVVLEAAAQSDKIIILAGTVFQPRTPRNPWAFEERRDMIMLSLPPEIRHRVSICPILDWTYMGNRWFVETKRVVNEVIAKFGLTTKPRIALIGHAKDSSSYYLKMFGPDWESIDVKNYLGINATNIRNAYFSNINDMWLRATNHKQGETIIPREHIVTDVVHQFLEQFATTPEYKMVRDEIEFALDYKSQFASLPYPPIFVTVDACVIHRGHVLLVRRKALPGKGLLALPGGFIGQDETLLNAVLRELKEETNIAVPPKVLSGSLVKNREFDDPFRSARGRTITHAYLFVLSNDMDRPKIRGVVPDNDDAGDPDGGTAYAQWYDLSKIDRKDFFEDHYFIISALTADL